jgi:GxxExxY protein
MGMKGMNGIKGMSETGGTGEWAHDTPLTKAIIGAAYVVSNGLGCGFLEKVYENALAVELKRVGLDVEQQKPIEVRWRGELIGMYQPDLVVNDKVVIELKAVRSLERVHWAQCMNYLRAGGLQVGLLLNFGMPRLEIQRVELPSSPKLC